ncbi:MAG: protein translocase subunit SecF [Candidatus Woesearchaeota archaeon]
MQLKEFYDKNYKKLTIIPILLVLIALGLIIFNYVQTGNIMQKDVSLEGGVTATISTSASFEGLKDRLTQSLPESEISVRSLSEFGTEEQIGILIEATDVEEEQLTSALKEFFGFELTGENYSTEQVGSTLGKSFYRQMMVAMFLAFLFMSIVVLITFRTFIPSIAVIFAAFSDIVITVAVANLLGIKFSTAGLAALMMLIGYSIDTDILLTTKAIKRKEEGLLFERMFSAMKTGLTMTVTTLVALSAGLFVTESFVIKQMFTIIIIGLIADIIATYLMNAGLLYWYVRRKLR